MKLIKIRKFLAFAPIIIAALSFQSCSDSVTSPVDNLDISIMSTADTTDYFSINTLTLDTVKVLIKDIKLNVSGSNDSANFKVGPYVLYLDLTSGVNLISTGIVPAGTYDKIKFEIHKLEASETPPDPEFADANGRYSVIAKGSFNGTRFIYRSDKSAHQFLDFPAILQMSVEGKSNVTLNVKPYTWFRKDGDFMNPDDTANSNDIDNNIKDSFKGFRDNDRNGIPD